MANEDVFNNESRATRKILNALEELPLGSKRRVIGYVNSVMIDAFNAPMPMGEPAPAPTDKP